MGPPVSPRRILAVQPQDKLAELPPGPRPPRLAASGVGPMSGDEPAMPSQHRRWLHDQEHLSEAVTIEHLGQHAEDRAVRVIEGRLWHLALQHQKLVTQRENLGIATVAAGEQETNTSQHKANNERHGPKHDRDPTGSQPPDQHRRLSGTSPVAPTRRTGRGPTNFQDTQPSQLPNPISKHRCQTGPHRRQIIRPLTPAVPHRHPDPTSDPRRDHHQQHQPIEQRADDGKTRTWGTTSEQTRRALCHLPGTTSFRRPEGPVTSFLP